MSMNSAVTNVVQQEYEALREGAAVLARPDSASLTVRGADRADFLHRMTTNDINSLRAGQAAVTVLTTPTAHIRFVFTVLCREDEMLLLPAPGQSEALSAHLRSQIFFMDQVEVGTVEGHRVRVMGPAAAEILSDAGLLQADAADDSWWEAQGALIVRQDRYDIAGYELLSTGSVEELIRILTEHGASLLTDDVAYTARRVEVGRPAPGHELVEEYNPLEAGLAWACSDHKGCYTGQEIIARQITYDKVTKYLSGLVCDGPVAAGDDAVVDGKAVGKVTSAAFSPGLGKQIALAVLRQPNHAAGTLVDLRRDENRVAGAEVVELPFD